MNIGLRAFRIELGGRLQRGEQLILHGPRGAGKSTLIAALALDMTKAGIPCGVSDTTAHLDDITRAFARAYPGVDTLAVHRRLARARLRSAADRRSGVLFLDHVTGLSNAMLGYLRRLRGGIAGVLLAVDVETERERLAVRQHSLGMFLVAMPRVPVTRLRGILRSRCRDANIGDLPADQERRILRAARGRPGWIERCADLMRHERYWNRGRLYTSLLSMDTEIVLRRGTLGPFDASPGAALRLP